MKKERLNELIEAGTNTLLIQLSGMTGPNMGELEKHPQHDDLYLFKTFFVGPKGEQLSAHLEVGPEGIVWISVPPADMAPSRKNGESPVIIHTA